MPYLDDDIVDLRRDDGSSRQYYWGDEVELLSTDVHGNHRIKVKGRNGPIDEGYVRKEAKFRPNALLRLSMIDVQQGDGMIIETPGGKVIFIDGGDNQLFARHAAARFRGTSEANPLIVDLMLVTHGDADHFEGLNKLRESEKDKRQGKSIFLAPKRYYHNGIVKRPDSVAEKERLGALTTVDGTPFITGLTDDPASLPASDRNGPFQRWMDTLAAWEPRVQAATGQAIERRRLDHRAQGAFDFLSEDGITVELLGPVVEDTPGGPGLRFLRKPEDDAGLMLGNARVGSKPSWSASHTINGHSIAFRMRYGNVRFLLTGDMNKESAQRLREAMPGAALQAEILKAPHHGSADFDMAFLQAAEPVVSLISSGDESESKEYIHPRATLLSALGKASRTTPAVIFITELAAFFKTVGYLTHPESGRPFYAFERTNFGIAHVRTDGERVLAFTHSGKAGFNEAYRFTVSEDGKVVFAPKAVKRSAPAKAG